MVNPWRLSCDHADFERDLAHKTSRGLLVGRLQSRTATVTRSVMMNSSGSLKLRRFLLAAALLLVCQPAWAEKRVALVIGNAAYQNVARLPNPVNDGAVIAATLRNAGFDVVDSRQRPAGGRNAPRAARFRRPRPRCRHRRGLLRRPRHRGGRHQLSDSGRCQAERDIDVYDEALSLDRVLLAIEPAKQLRLVILDACRDNPFCQDDEAHRRDARDRPGLAKVEPTSPNTLIAYSAKAGSTAADGDGKNSPFTAALSKHLATPGLDVRRAFGFVRDEC